MNRNTGFALLIVGASIFVHGLMLVAGGIEGKLGLGLGVFASGFIFMVIGLCNLDDFHDDD